MAVEFTHAILKLADDALARDRIQIRLGIAWIGIFHASALLHHRLKLPIGLGGTHLHRVPRLGLYLQTDAPRRMLTELVDKKLRISIHWIVTIDTAVEAIGEICLLRR